MTRLALAILLVLAFIGSGFAQNAVGKKSSAQSGCKLVGTVKGTKLWAGDCAAPDQLRDSVIATQADEPSLQDQARGAIPAGQK